MKDKNTIKRTIVLALTFSIGMMASTTVISAKKTSTKTIVADMYTYTCEECGYDKAEGDYSYVSEQGFERCPECNTYRDIFSPRD